MPPDPRAQSVVVDRYRDSKGRYTVCVDRAGVGSALGYSWSSFEAAEVDANAFLDRVASDQSHSDMEN